jgi:hypothetical protein
MYTNIEYSALSNSSPPASVSVRSVTSAYAPINRYAVNDPTHYNRELWLESTQSELLDRVSLELKRKKSKYTSVSMEQLINVMDSVSQSNPHKGLFEVKEMIVSYIVSYITNEESVNETPEYDKSVVNYDGSYGIQRLARGQLSCIRKDKKYISREF